MLSRLVEEYPLPPSEAEVTRRHLEKTPDPGRGGSDIKAQLMADIMDQVAYGGLSDGLTESGVARHEATRLPGLTHAAEATQNEQQSCKSKGKVKEQADISEAPPPPYLQANASCTSVGQDRIDADESRRDSFGVWWGGADKNDETWIYGQTLVAASTFASKQMPNIMAPSLATELTSTLVANLRNNPKTQGEEKLQNAADEYAAGVAAYLEVRLARCLSQAAARAEEHAKSLAMRYVQARVNTVLAKIEVCNELQMPPVFGSEACSSHKGSVCLSPSMIAMDGVPGQGNNQPGRSVRLCGMDDAELDGSTGICLNRDADTGRWNVRLETGEVRSLKPTNFVSEDEAPPSPVHSTPTVRSSQSKGSRDLKKRLSTRSLSSRVSVRLPGQQKLSRLVGKVSILVRTTKVMSTAARMLGRSSERSKTQ